MAGPWWYHTATSVPRARNLPFSLLRMLILSGCFENGVKLEIGTGGVRVVGSLTEDREGNKELRCLCDLLLGSRATKLPQQCFGGREGSPPSAFMGPPPARPQTAWLAAKRPSQICDRRTQGAG